MLLSLADRKKKRGRPRKNVSVDEITEINGIGAKGALSDIKQGGKDIRKGASDIKKGFGAKGASSDIKKGLADLKKGAEEIKKATRKASAKTKRGFKKEIVDTDVGKKIASTLIDVGADVLLPAGTSALSMALGDPTGLSGAVVGKVAGDQIQKQAEKHGYGLKGKALTAQKNKMTEHFIMMGASPKHAKALTNKVFREGENVLDMEEIAITGGKISLKKTKKNLIKEAKKIWRDARPVLKYAGETALSMAEPLVESGVKTVAMSYGMDPESADIASKVFTISAKDKVQKGLNRISKKKSKSPQEYVDEASKIIQDKSEKLIEKAEKKGRKAIEKSDMSDESKQIALGKLETQIQDAKNVVDLNVEKAETQIQKVLSKKKSVQQVQQTEQDMTGGMGLYSRNDMSTLLSPDSVAKQPFVPVPNVPQGQIWGGGLSAGMGTLYMDQQLGGSFRDLSGRGSYDRSVIKGSSFRL